MPKGRARSPRALRGALGRQRIGQRDGSRELPVFTGPDRPLIASCSNLAPVPQLATFQGEELWVRMLDFVKGRELQVAVDPGEPYGIRLRREMILGMINLYGSNSVRE